MPSGLCIYNMNQYDSIQRIQYLYRYIMYIETKCNIYSDKWGVIGVIPSKYPTKSKEYSWISEIFACARGASNNGYG